ncbi:MAG: transposase [Candidatus Riflebacteria bacterium]|nr:transposase [Candidatus Riflebacteria bacterium]
MARIARLVIPSIPHHITQRGNRRQRVFFSDDDYNHYLALLAEWCKKFSVEIWAYCLMPNHVHLIAVPSDQQCLQKGIAEAHRRYSRMINFRENWRGHLWQGRFASYPMDDVHLLHAARYIELNPVRAGLVKKPEDYCFSSAKAHLTGIDDVLVKTLPLLKRISIWSDFLEVSIAADTQQKLQKHERTGRPLGSDEFISDLETITGRVLTPKKPGPPKTQVLLVK